MYCNPFPTFEVIRTFCSKTRSSKHRNAWQRSIFQCGPMTVRLTNPSNEVQHFKKNPPKQGHVETVQRLPNDDSRRYFVSGEMWLIWVARWKSCHAAGRQTDLLCLASPFFLTHCSAKVRIERGQETPISTLLPHHCHQPHRNSVCSVRRRNQICNHRQG